jgi:glucose-6-phosphate 1-epimerase
VIFPQFAAEGPLPKHGFARNTPWTLRDNRHDADGSAVAVFTLASSAIPRPVWPHEFLATVTVRVHG